MRTSIHQSRLSQEQQDWLKAQVRGQWKGVSHLKEQMEARNISQNEIQDAMRNGWIVQYQIEDDSSRRILLRNEKGICTVLDMTHHKVITAYRNSPNDSHRTLDRSQYYWGTVTDQMVKGQ